MEGPVCWVYHAIKKKRQAKLINQISNSSNINQEVQYVQKNQHISSK